MVGEGPSLDVFGVFIFFFERKVDARPDPVFQSWMLRRGLFSLIWLQEIQGRDRAFLRHVDRRTEVLEGSDHRLVVVPVTFDQNVQVVEVEGVRVRIRVCISICVRASVLRDRLLETFEVETLGHFLVHFPRSLEIPGLEKVEGLGTGLLLVGLLSCWRHSGAEPGPGLGPPSALFR